MGDCVSAVACAAVFSWTDDEGNSYKGGSGDFMCPGNSVTSGYLIVPDGSAAGTEFDLPFPSVLNAATYIFLLNKTGQDLNMAWGGNWFPHLAAGGMLLFASPTAPTAGGITSLRFMLTKGQSGIGKLKYAVCGF